jgi:predicted RecB family endonuclease
VLATAEIKAVEIDQQKSEEEIEELNLLVSEAEETVLDRRRRRKKAEAEVQRLERKVDWIEDRFADENSARLKGKSAAKRLETEVDKLWMENRRLGRRVGNLKERYR